MNYSSEHLLALVNTLPDPIFILTESGIYADLLGGKNSAHYHDGSFLIGKRLDTVLPADKAEWFKNEIHRTLESGELRVIEYDLAGSDVDGLDVESGPAGVLRFEGRIFPLKELYHGERAVIWVAINISEKYAIRQKIEQLTVVDELTGAANRRAFDQRITQAYEEHTRYQTPTSLAIIDIDWFKQINDSLGHVAGDTVLKLFTHCCKSILRSTDFLARYGGDEFVIIFPQTTANEALSLVDRLRTTLDNCTELTDLTKITISVGLSKIESNDASPRSALERADEALYQVKKQGRNATLTF